MDNILISKLFSETDSMKTPSLFSMCSFSHFFWGFVFFIIMKYYNAKLSFNLILILFFVIHTIYEIKDTLCYFGINLFNNKKIDSYFMNNSYLNSIGDTIFGLLGVYIASLYLKNKHNIYLKILILIVLIFASLCTLDILKSIIEVSRDLLERK